MIQHKKKIISLILKTTLIASFSLGIILILAFKINKQSKELINQKRIILINQLTQQKLIELQTDYNQIAPALPKLEQTFLEGDKIVSFVGEIEKIAKESQNEVVFKFDNIAPSPIANSSLKTVDFSITLSGNINTFFEFFKKLEYLAFFTTIKSTSISGRDGLLNNSTLNLKGILYVK